MPDVLETSNRYKCNRKSVKMQLFKKTTGLIQKAGMPCCNFVS
jgi:hypothetical protein